MLYIKYYLYIVFYIQLVIQYIKIFVIKYMDYDFKNSDNIFVC